MTSSRAFLLGLPAGLGLACLAYFAVFRLQLGAPTEASHWTSGILESKRRIAAQLEGHRLLLAGGSSVLFGLSAATIEEATGIPTVNLGSHAALGTRYLLRYVREVARPGDTVLLTLAYELYSQGDANFSDWVDPVFIDFVLARDPDFFDSLPLGERFEIALMTSFSRLKRGLRARLGREKPNPSTGVYDPRFLNPRGDQTLQGTEAYPPVVGLDSDQPFPALSLGVPDPLPAGSILEEFLAWAETQDIRVLATFPNIAHHPAYDLAPAQRTPELIRRFYAAHGIPVLGTAREAILPVTDFYDTRYHLTESAVKERTRRLLAPLREALGVSDSASEDLVSTETGW